MLALVETAAKGVPSSLPDCPVSAYLYVNIRSRMFSCAARASSADDNVTVQYDPRQDGHGRGGVEPNQESEVLRRELHDAVGMLRGQEHRVMLRFLAGDAPRETSTITGIPAHRIRASLSKAIRHLKDRLGGIPVGDERRQLGSGYKRRVGRKTRFFVRCPGWNRLRNVSREEILSALQSANWVISSAAKRLSMPRSTLCRRMHKLGIKNPPRSEAQQKFSTGCAPSSPLTY